MVQDGKVELFFVEETQNLADIFAKNLGCIKFLKFQEQFVVTHYFIKVARTTRDLSWR
jgi:hypothetical protein